jgi:DNA-directed RNA polymerase specialized sigma24 family protein
MTKQELRSAETRYRRASAIAETHRQARNAAVRQALADGWTYAQIAEVTGLTRGRIGQLHPDFPRGKS